MDATLWHVAPRNARISIESHGIDWKRSRRASEPLRGYDDEGNTIDLLRANYLYLTAESARDCAASIGEADIYQVDAYSIVELHSDPYEDTEAVYTIESIPPQHIKRIV